MCAGRDDTAVEVTAGNFRKRDDLQKLDVIIDLEAIAGLVVINNYF